MSGATRRAAKGTSGTQTSALSLQNRPNVTAMKTAKGIAHPGSESASSASSAPMPPRTSAMPTMPLMASVSTAHVAKTSPASHACPRRCVHAQTIMVMSAALMAWKTTL